MLGIAAMYGLASEGSAQQLTQQTRYSTYDWTAPTGSTGEVLDFREFWADVKTPGDGFAYAVGTIEVQDTRPGALFSGVPAQSSVPATISLTNNLVLRNP
jgi:hypothetical protein